MAQPSTTAYLLLDVAGVSCALRRDAVREILPQPHLHEPPASGGPLAGFVNFGGEPLAVLDLARLLGLRDGPTEPDPYRHIVLAADGDVGLLVDRVMDLVHAAPDAVRRVADTRTLNGCVEAEITIDDRLIHGLSMERILTIEERARVADLARRAAERLAAFPAHSTV